LRQYSAKHYVGEHRTDSIYTFNIEEVVKAYSKAVDDAQEAILNQKLVAAKKKGGHVGPGTPQAQQKFMNYMV
jgi:hypothetical protein